MAGLLLTVSTCRLDDLVNAGRLGTLDVTPLTVRDSARVGSTAPRVMTATLAVGGTNGAVPWTLAVIGASPWLRPAATGGTVPGTLSVSLDPSNLAEGTYRDTIAFSLSGTEIPPIKVPVEFIIQPCAVTTVTPPEARRDTITAADCGAPHRGGRFAKLYRFTATGGDSITVAMGSSALDAFLLVDTSLSPTALPLAENDACTTSAADACLRYLYLPRPGDYFIEASTSPPGTAGDFLLQVSRPRPPLLPDTLLQSTNDVQNLGIAVGGAVADSSIVLRASLVDPDGDSLRMEVEVRPVGTPFTDTPTGAGPLFPGGSGTQVVVTGLSDDVAYHWQVRARDRTGRASAWRPFGGNAETAGDFRVAIPQAPAAPGALAQLKTDGTTAITLGGLTDEATALFRATLTDADPGDQIRLEVEVRPVGTAFSDAASGSSLPVATTGAATATITGLADNVTYHWQARAVDQTGRASPWGSFGGNLETAADFRVAIAPARLTVLTQPGASTAGQAIAPAVRVAAQDAQGNTLASFTGAATAAIGTNPAGGTLSGTTSVVAAQGIATFSALALDRAASGYTLLLSAGGINVTTAAFTIAPGAARQLAFAAAPTSATAGAALNPAVQVAARDSIGNVATAFTGNVTVALGANPGGGSLGGTLTQQAVAGVATFNNLTINRTGAGYTLTASATNLTDATSAPITVTSGAATQLLITTQPAVSGNSGGALLQQPAVDVRDAGGNVITQAGVLVTATVASGPAGASLANATATSDNQGRATFSGLTITGRVGAYTLQFTAPGLAADTSTTITLGAGAATTLALATPPSSGAQSGALFAQQPAIQLVDGAGNSVTQAGVDVSVAIATGGGALGGTTTIVTGTTGLAAFTDLSITGASGPRTLGFSATNLMGVTSGTIAIGAGAATRILLRQGTGQSATAGSQVAIPPAVLVVDADSNPVQGVDVTFAVTVGTGAVVPTTAIATDGNGVATVTSWTLGALVGANELRATAAGLSGSPVIFSATGTVGAAALMTKTSGDNLTGPVDATLGTPHEVTVTDANGNPVAGVTVNFAAASGGGSTNPTIATTDVDGRATTVRTLGPGATTQTTTATATLTGGTTTVTFSITATVGGASQMVPVMGDDQRDTVGATLPTLLAVRVTDGLNPVPNVLVTWTVTDGGGAVSPDTIRTDPNGIASTRWTLGTVTGPTDSTQGVRAAAGPPPVNFIAIARPGSVSDTASRVDATPGVITASNGSSTSTITVTVRDRFGNPIPGRSVSLASTPQGAFVPPGPTNASGVATGFFSSTATGPHTIQTTVVTATGNVVATQQPIVTVNPASATSLRFLTQPTDAVAGVDLAPDVRVEALDAFQNRATGASGNVDIALRANPGGATLAGTRQRAFVNGVATFFGLSLNRAASGYTFEATSGSLIAVSNTFAISVGAASAAQTTASVPNGTAGAATTFTITVRDASGNIRTAGGDQGLLDVDVTGANTALNLTVSDAGGGSYTASYTPTAAGPDNVAITLNAAAINGSPFTSTVGVGAASAAQTTASVPNGTAGSVTTFTITVRDASGNIRTAGGDQGLLDVDVTGANTALNLTVADAGGGSYTASYTPTAAGPDNVAITLNAAAINGSPFTSTVGVGAASATQTTASVLNGTAGATTTFTITVRDASGNIRTAGGDQGLLDVDVTGANTALNLTVADAGGGSYTAAYTPTAAGPDNVAITLNAAAINGSPFTSTVDPSTAANLVVTTQPPASRTADQTFGLVVTARDQFGNTATGFTDNVGLRLLGGTANANLLGTKLVAAVAGVATLAGLQIDSVGTGYTIEAADSTGAATDGDTTTAIAITPGAANAATSTVAASPGAITASGGSSTSTIAVTARDQFGNVIDGAAVALASTGANNTFTADSTGTTSGGGVFSRAFSSTTVDIPKVISATVNSVALTQTATVTVSAGSATQMTFTPQPGNQIAGRQFSATVILRDAFGNVKTNFNSPVTFTIRSGTGDPAASLGGTTVNVTMTSGIATTSNLTIDSAASGYELEAAFGFSIPNAFSAAFTVAPDTASTATSLVTVVPTSVSFLAGDTAVITLQARDSVGNNLTSGGLTVAFSLVDASLGTIGPTTDKGDGTYVATFFPAVGLTATSDIDATINGATVTRTPKPTITRDP